MLGKLIKHEFKNTGRYILLIMAILAIVTPITAAYLRFSTDRLTTDKFTIFELFNGLSILLYVCAMIGVAVATFILLLYRFYKSMISAESYLTHTLPVKTSSIITSKLLVAFVWEVASTALMILSILVFTYILGAWKFSDLNADTLNTIFNDFKIAGFNAANVIEAILLTVFSLINSLLLCFVSFAIGQRMNGHQFLGSVLAYIVITIVIQIISSFLAVGFSIWFSSIDNQPEMSVNPYMHVFMIGLLIFQIVTSALYYIVTVYMFKKKLNI